MPNEKEKAICYKMGRLTIYFSDPSGRHHFVPERNWDLYMAHRKTQPTMCHIFNTILEARIGAIEYFDLYRDMAHLIDAR